jgi:hypothetical protein
MGFFDGYKPTLCDPGVADQTANTGNANLKRNIKKYQEIQNQHNNKCCHSLLNK